jgi:hypothetical protein
LAVGLSNQVLDFLQLSLLVQSSELDDLQAVGQQSKLKNGVDVVELLTSHEEVLASEEVTSSHSVVVEVDVD